ncbi:PKD domain-containing protein [Candidatus Peregrinibacteria bacterium]|jgi:hypothetical protein|nr:PKD domain-containing protein [Candidatus Peregrinibacteria bacterium]MBT4148176.1 PKD domain-containing protein [Candidatus Peregrinibacteria bacterium]MBT4365887.1 PKD domain-containing protein [Candidatus Peregrinibacteria bacterium]MBT4455650.1 PKD domain-containing protein [Candidatus Peregrinibacteria bacterium]
MKKIIKISFLALGLLLFSSLPSASAAGGDLSITSSNVQFSTSSFLEGRTIRIYGTVTNNSTTDLLGTVRFFDNGGQIGGDQAISLFGNRADDVFVDWVPGWGSHTVKVTIFPWEEEGDDPTNNIISRNIYVLQDTDFDGITNEEDEDDDGDGVIDTEDEFPLNNKEWVDTDGDGIGDNEDEDADNDGVPDVNDQMPLDPTETTDTDSDGIGDIADTDDDGDGIDDNDEVNQGTDALNPDTDADGTVDGSDPFPLDEAEWSDNDSDNIGDNKDLDDDNDGFLDTEDPYPLNKGPVVEINKDAFTAALGQKAVFDSSDSYDEDGEIVSFVWEIDGNIIKEGEKVLHEFDTLGDHKVKLTIQDDAGETRTSEFQVSVLNIRLYSQVFTILITLILAGIIAYKYLAEGNLLNLRQLATRKSKKK